MTMKAIALIGDLYLGPLSSAGAKPLYYWPHLNATSLQLNPGKVDTIKRMGRGLSTDGTVLNAINDVGDAAVITIGNDEFRAEVLALQIRGLLESITQAAETQTDLEITVQKDLWVPLWSDHLATDTVTVKLESNPATTYTEGTHFEVNRQQGLIRFLSSAAGSPNNEVKVLVTFNIADNEMLRVGGSNTLPQRYAVLYDGFNKASGKRARLRIPQAMIAPDGDLDLLKKDFVNGSLQVTPELVTGETAAYYYEEDK